MENQLKSRAILHQHQLLFKVTLLQHQAILLLHLVTLLLPQNQATLLLNQATLLLHQATLLLPQSLVTPLRKQVTLQLLQNQATLLLPRQQAIQPQFSNLATLQHLLHTLQTLLSQAIHLQLQQQFKQHQNTQLLNQATLPLNHNQVTRHLHLPQATLPQKKISMALLKLLLTMLIL